MAGSHFYKDWAEVFFLILMIMGILIAILAPSAFISYLIVFISGLFAGRILFERKHKLQFPYYMIIGGFLIGYIIGIYYGSRKLAFLLFVIGAFISYQLFEKNIIKDAKY